MKVFLSAATRGPRVDRRALARSARTILSALGSTDAELSVRLVDDAEIARLAGRYGRRARATDVLAFAQREGAGRGDRACLGDVVISLDTAARQARAGLEAEVLFLWSHGLCHLLGYDHRTDREEAKMNARMRALADEGARRGRTRPA